MVVACGYRRFTVSSYPLVIFVGNRRSIPDMNRVNIRHLGMAASQIHQGFITRSSASAGAVQLGGFAAASDRGL